MYLRAIEQLGIKRQLIIRKPLIMLYMLAFRTLNFLFLREALSQQMVDF